MNKEIDMKNGDIEHLRSEKVKLETVIKSLEKDINGLKKEIQERDETIQDKVILKNVLKTNKHVYSY